MYEIVIINGKDYPVRFGMNALRMFCKDTDRALSDLDKLENNEMENLGKPNEKNFVK